MRSDESETHLMRLVGGAFLLQEHDATKHRVRKARAVGRWPVSMVGKSRCSYRTTKNQFLAQYGSSDRVRKCLRRCEA